MPTLPTPLQELVTALRSGKYKQTRGALQIELNGEASFCCLGVACSLYAQKHEIAITKLPVAVNVDGDFAVLYDGSASYLPRAVQDYYGLATNNGVFGGGDDYRYTLSLAAMNDERAPFSEIADTIEKHWESMMKGATT